MRSMRKLERRSSSANGDLLRARVTCAPRSRISRSSRSRADPWKKSRNEFRQLEDTLCQVDYFLAAEGGGCLKHVLEGLGSFLDLILDRQHLNDILAIYFLAVRQVLDRHRDIHHLEGQPRCDTQ